MTLPEGLLNDDGVIDARGLRDPSDDETAYNRVRPEECAFWRRALANGKNVRELSSRRSGRRNEKTIREHATGACDCDVSAPRVRHTTGNPIGDWVSEGQS